MQCLNGFLGNEAVGERAAYIGRNVRRERQQALFPDITFTCSGTLHGWFMVLEDRGQARGRNKYPEMQLWRRLGATSSYTKIHSMSGPPLDTTYSNVYKYSGLSIEFQRGDVLGVHQSSDKKSRYAILFQERGGHVYYDIRDDNPQGQFSPDDSDVRSNQSDYPLVGLDSSKLAMYTHALLCRVIIFNFWIACPKECQCCGIPVCFELSYTFPISPQAIQNVWQDSSL